MNGSSAMPARVGWRIAGWLGGAMCCVLAPSAAACGAPGVAVEATASEIGAFVRGRGMSVLSFTGYSDAGYQDPQAMLDQAAGVLAARDPAKTLVNIGATASGIGAVYEVAKRKGFTTMGIVSVLARDEKLPLSPCVDFVFYVRDASWGGRRPGRPGARPAGHLPPPSTRRLDARVRHHAHDERGPDRLVPRRQRPQHHPGRAAGVSDPAPGEAGSPRALTVGGALAGLLVALFVIGIVGWLVQGAGSDESVPTVPFTAPTAPPPVGVTAPLPSPSSTP
jgi:hypothetical protein